MVPVILSDEKARHPSEDHGWASESNDTNEFLKYVAMTPVREGLKHVLTGRVFAVEEPDVLHSEHVHSMTQFHLAHQAEGGPTLTAHIIVASLTVCDVNGFDLLALVEQLG